jgi:hypothetical protein
VMAYYKYIGREYRPDYKWESYCQKIRISDTLSIPINPAPWKVKIDNSIREKNKIC